MPRLYDHKEWYNEKNIIHLSDEAQRKQKKTVRTNYLPSTFNVQLHA